MEDLLQQLERRIQVLAERCQCLEHANYQLRKSKSVLLREKEALTAKNKVAISQIEHMIFHLKSLEDLQ